MYCTFLELAIYGNNGIDGVNSCRFLAFASIKCDFQIEFFPITFLPEPWNGACEDFALTIGTTHWIVFIRNWVAQFSD